MLPCDRRQRGAALVYVLALLAITSVLVGLTWRIIRSNNAIAAMDRGDVQARLLALTGVDYALAKSALLVWPKTWTMPRKTWNIGWTIPAACSR